MHLTPREQEKLLIFTAAELARRRRARGLKLNHPEAVAIITAEGIGKQLNAETDVLSDIAGFLAPILAERSQVSA